MIEEIFEMIMKEARARPGKDLIKNIATVSMDIAERIMPAMEGIRAEERRKEQYETQVRNIERRNQKYR